MRQIDQQYMQTPFYGSRRMTHHLKQLGYRVNRKRIQRLMRLMGIEAIYPNPKRSTINSEHQVYPYLLRDYEVTAANEVWSADITYIPMSNGFMYLVAILDWYSRYVITWELSNSLGGSSVSTPCITHYAEQPLPSSIPTKASSLQQMLSPIPSKPPALL